MDRLVLCVLGGVLIAANISLSFAMTREQLKKTTKVMKNSCISKNEVTEEMVGTIEQGNIPEDRNVMCYVACIYRMLQVIKNGKLDYESSIKAVDLMFPEDLKAPTKQAIENCRDIDLSGYSSHINEVPNPVPKVGAGDLLSALVYMYWSMALSAIRHIASSHKDVCVAAHEVLKCMYKSDPDNFFFP